jgi:hypothetical protein
MKIHADELRPGDVIVSSGWLRADDMVVHSIERHGERLHVIANAKRLSFHIDDFVTNRGCNGGWRRRSGRIAGDRMSTNDLAADVAYAATCEQAVTL